MSSHGRSVLVLLVLATMPLLTLAGCADFWVNPALTAITVTPLTPTITAETGTPPTCASGSVCTVQMTATGTFSDGTTSPIAASWSSSDPTIAAVNSNTGLVTGAGAGTATITAASGTVSGSTSVTVALSNLQSITLNPAGTLSLSVGGGAHQFTATGTFVGGGTQDITNAVTWNSSNTTAATVSNNAGSKGLVTPVTAGQTTNITAVSGSITSPATVLNVTP